MNEPTPSNAEALERVLQRYDLSLQSFLSLRADSYERVLAGHSLEQLELFYALLFDPKLNNEERAAQAPYWPKGSGRDGEPPSERTVRDARRRIFKERSLNDVSQLTDYIDSMRQKLGGQSAGNQRAVLDMVLDAVGEEMMARKLEGQAVSDKIDAAQLLLFAQASKDKAEQENAKIALKKQEAARKDEELKLAKDKFEVTACELFIKLSKDKRAQEIANSNASNETKILQLRQTYFADVDALQQSGQVELPPV